MARVSSAGIVRTIGPWLKEQRERLDLSQAEIASRLGYDYGNFISMLERGSALFPVQKIAQYADAYEVDQFDLARVVCQELLPDIAKYLDELHALRKTKKT